MLRNMETISLSDSDRTLISQLIESNNRLADALTQRKAERVFSCREFAKMIGKSPQTISRYIAQGRIKKAVRGGVIGIPESELQKITAQ